MTRRHPVCTLFPYTTLFRSELVVLGKAIAQTVESFRDRLARITRERLRTGIDLDARDDAERRQVFGKRHPVTRLLSQRFVVEDRSEEHTSELQSRAMIVCSL